jgi:large subunit ribosomal protein L31e
LSQELERVYTIPLGKVKLSQSQHRAVRAINMIKEFARHHMKVEEIKIEEDLAHLIWSKGVRNPPRKVRVRLSKTDEGYILVSLYDEDVESAVTPEKETKKVEDKVEEPTIEAAEEPTPEVPAKKPAKKEEVKSAKKPAKKPAKKEEVKSAKKPAKKEEVKSAKKPAKKPAKKNSK